MEKLNIRDLYRYYGKCKEHELSLLWQRSIFLTAFFLLCFTGYGKALKHLFDMSFWYDTSGMIPVNTLCIGLSVIGVILSLIWVMMGKASKTWYQKYEKKIKEIEADTDFTDQNVVEFRREILEWCGNDNIDKKLHTTNGGVFSQSGLNIIIGQVFTIIWTVVLLIHSLSFLFLIFYSDSSFITIIFNGFVTFFSLVCVAVFISTIYFTHWACDKNLCNVLEQYMLRKRN